MKIRRVKFSDADVNKLVSKVPPRPPDNQSIDFLNCVVQKPWGSEYLMFQNNFVEIWNLKINPNQFTSMHCHPNKKTGLILLSGEALFSNLDKSWLLKPFDSVVIEASTFHQTKALSKDGIRLVEVETPPAKHDLIRLHDGYGRENFGYEGREQMIFNNLNDYSVRFADLGGAALMEKQFSGCRFSINKIGSGQLSGEQIDYLSAQDLLVVLEGIIYWPQNDETYGVAEILKAKDVLDNQDSVRMFNLTLLGIKNNLVAEPNKDFKTFWSRIIFG